MVNQFSKTGIYMRLSRDDEKAGESMSIENQRTILRKYVAERGGLVIEEYADDGWSGTNFDRPAVKRMLEDAQSGRIDTIVVKDLSRFGRNYIQVGQYIDYIFPAYGIRFIAINDNVDTADRGSTAMDMMPVMNVFNEWHAANTSKKIRAVLEASQRSGKYTNWNYPYGYKAGVDTNRTAVIDEEAASVVRRIFQLRLQGSSARAICRILTDEGIPNPATYFTRADGEKSKRVCSSYWVPKTVMWILSNPTYLGSTVQHKTTSVSYKNHKIIRLPASEQIVKENAHEAIISRDLWDKVQAINQSVSRGRADKKNTLHALSGLLVCANCGKKLKYKSAGGQGGFACRTYVDLGKKYCSSHSISERLIEQIILQDIRSMLSPVMLDEKKTKERFVRKKAMRDGEDKASDEKLLKAKKSRLSELDKLIEAAFEERVLKKMPESVCVSLCGKYEKERIAVYEEIAALQSRLAKSNESPDDAEEYVRRIKAYSKCETLTREMCLQLIEFVMIGEKSEKGGAREIHIYYKLGGFSPNVT